MILCDPFAINTLSLSTIRHLQELVSQETLPRVSIGLAGGCAEGVCPLVLLGSAQWVGIGTRVPCDCSPKVLSPENRGPALFGKTREWHSPCELLLRSLSSYRIVPTSFSYLGCWRWVKVPGT